MLTNVFRDESLVEALGPSLQGVRGYLQAAGDVLARGLSRKRVARAAIAHALSFGTWCSLTRANGLSEREAVSLMVGMVERAAAR